MGEHRSPGTESVAHPWLRNLTASFSILILTLTAIGGGAVFAINGLGVNIGAIDTSDLNEADRPDSVAQTDTSPTNLLIMGSDSRDGDGNDTYGVAGGARSDTTLLVHLYNNRQDAVVVSIPRDSWVELAACTRPNGSTTLPYTTKFNAAFAFGGPVCTIKTFENLTNIRINNFVVVDFNAFKTVVDAIGGVEVCLTTPAYDPVVPGRGGSGLNLPAGYSTISGEQSLAFVRARTSLGDGSDLSRIKRQQDFIGAMIRSMTDKGLLTNPPMIYRVLGAITSSIETNPEFANIEALQNFALSLGGLSPARVKFVTIPFELKDDGNVYWTTQTDELWTALRTDQPWPPVVPEPTASSSPTPTSTTVAVVDPTPAEIKVAVLNATTTVGRGSAAAEELKTQKFNVIKVGNSTKRLAVSEILYTAASEQEARVLGAATGITTLTLDNTLVSPVVLLAGTDWKDGKVTTVVTPTVISSPAAEPSPTPDQNAGTAASTVCTEGNNRVKK